MIEDDPHEARYVQKCTQQQKWQNFANNHLLCAFLDISTRSVPRLEPRLEGKDTDTLNPGECGQMLASSFSAVTGESEETTRKKTPLRTETNGTQMNNQHTSYAQGKRSGDHLAQLKRVVTLI